MTIIGSPGTEAEPNSYAPRRTLLDKILVDAARESGAEVREAFTVDEIIVEDGNVVGIRGHERGGDAITERARVVIGADGRHSMVAREVKAEQYNERPEIESAYYSYFSDLPMSGHFETYIRPGRGFAAWPTNDDLTLVVGGWPIAEFEENKKDIEGNFMRMLDMVPPFANRVRAGKREDRWYGAAVPNFFRKPFGPGWALTGDAGYNKDFITAMGISDAFSDADLCASALHAWLAGDRDLEEAMSAYQQKRDAHAVPVFELTCQIAALEPPPPEMQQLLGAIVGNQDAMDQFAQMLAGVKSPTEFYAPENMQRIFAAAQKA